MADGQTAAAPKTPAASAGQRGRAAGSGPAPRLYAAIDLGTNNCRLLIAQRAPGGFRVVDSFSRIVRLGEGVAHTGALSEAAMERTIDALEACARKLHRRHVARIRAVATQACRMAANGADFIGRVRRETGIALETIAPAEEARLAVLGCANLIDRSAEGALVVDIGGGSTELSWARAGRPGYGPAMGPWCSLPVGVVTLVDRHPEQPDRRAWYEAMKADVDAMLDGFAGAGEFAGAFRRGRAHVVGTSGAVTSLAGVHMQLPRYNRSLVDGAWLSQTDALAAAGRLLAMDAGQRAAEPCIGPDRADLVLAGAAILEAVLGRWPSPRIRVADRGLREGLILSMLSREGNRRGRGRKTK